MRGGLSKVAVGYAVAASLLAGCHNYVPIQGSEIGVSRRPLPLVRVWLRDDTCATFASPHLFDGSLRGDMIECEGASCARLRRVRDVRLSEVTDFQAMQFDRASTAVAITAGALAIAGAIVGVLAGLSGVSW